jgi:hypothetical protein
MSKKAGIWIGVTVLLVIILAFVGMTASAMAGESSKADAFLKDAVAKQMPQADVSRELQRMGFKMNDAAGSSTGTGPDHSLLVYSTHLVVDLTFDKDNKAHSYHLDKA